MNQFLEQIDYVIELIEHANWTDYLIFILAYVILVLGLLGSLKKNQRRFGIIVSGYLYALR